MEFLEIFKYLCYTVIIATVPVITYYIIKYLKELFNKISIETEGLFVHDTIDEAMSIILTVVSSTSQTFVDSLKASGNFDREAQKKAFNDTKETVLSLLSEEAKELITVLYSDLNTWLDVQIEAAVRNQKSIKEGE